MGQTLLTNFAPVPTNVRFAPKATELLRRSQ
jgi:hypothetical protein